MVTQCGPLALPLCYSMKSLLGKIISKDAACRGSLCSPTQSTCVAFTHLLLPGTARRRGNRSRSPTTSQTSQAAAHVPADMGELWVCTRQPYPLPRVWGPTQREITFIRKRRNYKYEPKQGNEASVGLNRKSRLRPLLWESALSGLSTYLSPLAGTESTSCLLTSRLFLAESEGIQVF